MENYIFSQRDHIFRNVEVLIYVFDVESREYEKDIGQYQACLEAISQHSKDAKVFCLIHKMDLVQDDQREVLFRSREADLKRRSTPLQITVFATSIWDETLYKAWSAIVYQLIPNIKMVESQLSSFAQICEADEVVLFERATFLVISHITIKAHNDSHRFEKISNIVKQFKLSCRYEASNSSKEHILNRNCCSKLQAQFHSMEVRSLEFSAFIDILTNNTYIMVITSDPIIGACPSFSLMVVPSCKPINHALIILIEL